MSDYRPIEDDDDLTSSSETPPPIDQDRGDVDATGPSSNKNKRVLIAIGICLLGLLLIGLVGMYFFNKVTGGGANEQQQEDPTLQPETNAGPTLGGFQEQINAAERARESERLRREREAEEQRLREQRAQELVERTTGERPPTTPDEAQAQQRPRIRPEGRQQDDTTDPDKRRLGGEVVIGGGGGGLGTPNGASGPGALFGGGNAGGENDTIGSMLEGETYDPGSATVMRNMDMLLRRGTIIPCVLQNKVVSTYPSLSSCVITQDVYSADGTTMLVRQGSVAYGEQKVTLTHGQARLFMTWNEIDTVSGVRVRIDSLATDNLGAAGVDAYVDNHFWERFGGAIMLSFLDDALEVAANRLSEHQNNSGTSFQSSTNNVQNMAEIALENSINIPPTGTVNQGALLNIRVARDVDFSSVYSLESRY